MSKKDDVIKKRGVKEEPDLPPIQDELEDDLAPATSEPRELNEEKEEEEEGGVRVHPEVSFRAQEFYRVLELAVADALPEATTNYKSLKLKSLDKDIPIWETVEKEISAQICSWPEWFAILNQGLIKPSRSAAAEKSQRTFSRYSNIKKSTVEVPSEFKGFNERFIRCAETVTQFTLDNIGKAVLYSLQRFETNSHYVEAARSLQSVINVDRLSQMEEGLPIVDSWQISRIAEELVPEILERISDEVEDLKNIRFPYDTEKPCFWNLALIVRIQVQLVRTIRDRISRLIAAAENTFQQFFVGEILRGDILPLVRSTLNDNKFLAGISAEGMVDENYVSRRSVPQSGSEEEPEGSEEMADMEEVSFEESGKKEDNENKEDKDLEEW
ncbi:MAG: hypothetical protein HUU50_14185 [Candidatus Brocadiae bacterium]|nr:hypothetical protein [Candidatus Brocadiia bacterium]